MMLPLLTDCTGKRTMKNQTETLTIGSPAPSFILFSANREGMFSIAEQLSSGNLIIEFLRGTW
jgi:hypothetical protein